MRNKQSSDLRLYLVTDAEMTAQRGLIETVIAAIDGGVTMVQLRDKHASDDALYQTACKLKEAIDGRVPLLMNDRVNIAKKANLDGAHIGQGDMSVDKAREILGADAWLGLSINTLAQLKEAEKNFLSQLDYVGLGPVYATHTKKNHATPLGVDGLVHLVNESPFSTVAIGGIHLSNASDVYGTGCDGIAVVSEVCASDNPKDAARALLNTLPNE